LSGSTIAPLAARAGHRRTLAYNARYRQRAFSHRQSASERTHGENGGTIEPSVSDFVWGGSTAVPIISALGRQSFEVERLRAMGELFGLAHVMQ
jgi:hypothetical protein